MLPQRPSTAGSISLLASPGLKSPVVIAPSAPPTPGARPGALPKTGQYSQRLLKAVPLPDPGTPSNAELWGHVVLPAITWLYGWVEWQLGWAQLPSIVEAEYRDAFASATGKVADAMRSQTDRLAACIWRAMVALLTHFVSCAEPLKRDRATTREKYADAQKEIEELKAQVARLKRRSHETMLAEHGSEEVGSGSDVEEMSILEDAMTVELKVKGETKTAKEKAAVEKVALPQTRLPQARSSQKVKDAMPQEELSPWVSPEELNQLRAQLVGAQRDVISERASKESALKQLVELRHGDLKTEEGAKSRNDARDSDRRSDGVESGGGDDGDERIHIFGEAETGDGNSKGTATGRDEKMPQRLGERRGTITKIESDMLMRLEDQLRQERRQRVFLERLRSQMIATVGEQYVLGIETQLKERGANGLEVNVAVLPEKVGARRDVDTQFEESDSTLAMQLVQSTCDEGDGDTDASQLSSLTRRLSHAGLPKNRRVRGAKGLANEQAVAVLNQRQINWTMQHVFDDKLKRDAVDELDHRPKQTLGAFMPDYFVNKHGLPNVAAKNQMLFREGLLASAKGGSRRALAFACLAGYVPLPGDGIDAITQPAAFKFYVELERKAMRASGADSDRSDGSLVWLPIDRAVELMRSEFRYARVTDVSKWTLDVEELLRLPDEIHEIVKARDASSNFVNATMDKHTSPARSGRRYSSPREPLTSSGPDLPLGHDEVLFRSKSVEGQERIRGRREEALVQNKVLRALNRRNINLRDLFSMLDVDQSGDIDADEFISGIQALEGQLSESQCAKLMERIDTDKSGTLDFHELTRALQKLDLRVEMHDFLVVCLRFFCAEMQRTDKILRARFAKLAGDGIGDGNEATASPEDIRTLLKALDVPFTHSMIGRLLSEMVNDEGTGAPYPTERWHISTKRAAPSLGRSKSALGVHAIQPSSPSGGIRGDSQILASAFTRTMMASGFHAMSSPSFKEVGVGLATSANSVMRASAVMKRLATPVGTTANESREGATLAADAPTASPHDHHSPLLPTAVGEQAKPRTNHANPGTEDNVEVRPGLGVAWLGLADP
jgi:hypothetical protein